jgi:hypothetical protein
MIVEFALWVYETLVVCFCACAVSLDSALVRETERFGIADSSPINAVSFSSARTFSHSPKSNRASCASASVTAQDDSYTRVAARYRVLP